MPDNATSVWLQFRIIGSFSTIVGSGNQSRDFREHLTAELADALDIREEFIQNVELTEGKVEGLKINLMTSSMELYLDFGQYLYRSQYRSQYRYQYRFRYHYHYWYIWIGILICIGIGVIVVLVSKSVLVLLSLSVSVSALVSVIMVSSLL